MIRVIDEIFMALMWATVGGMGTAYLFLATHNCATVLGVLTCVEHPFKWIW